VFWRRQMRVAESENRHDEVIEIIEAFEARRGVS
jgi:hypothetical protein